MYCEQCGVQIEEPLKSCPHCGFSRRIESSLPKHLVSSPKRRRWPFILAILFAILIGFYWLFSGVALPQDAILDQLETLKEKQLTKSYYDYTTKDFQKAISLDAFKKYIASTHVLEKAKSFILEEESTDGAFSTIRGYIIAEDGSSLEVVYNLVIEEGRWKILSFSPVEREVQEKPTLGSMTEQMIAPVKLFLEGIKTSQFEEIYGALAASDFIRNTPFTYIKTYIENNPILTTFSDYEIVDHQFIRGRGDLYVSLNPEEEDVPIAFTVIREKGTWKIFRIALGSAKEKQELQAKERFETVLIPFVKTSIEYLKNQNFTRFHEESASREFQMDVDIPLLERLVREYPLLSRFTELNVRDLGETGDLAWIDMEFKKGADIWVIEFTLGKDPDEWKILGMRMFESDSI